MMDLNTTRFILSKPALKDCPCKKLRYTGRVPTLIMSKGIEFPMTVVFMVLQAMVQHIDMIFHLFTGNCVRVADSVVVHLPDLRTGSDAAYVSNSRFQPFSHTHTHMETKKKLVEQAMVGGVSAHLISLFAIFLFLAPHTRKPIKTG